MSTELDLNNIIGEAEKAIAEAGGDDLTSRAAAPAPADTDTPAAPKASGKRKPRSTNPATSPADTAAAVAAAVAVVGGDLPEDDTSPAPAGPGRVAPNRDKPVAERMKPITRPNGQPYNPRMLSDLTDVETLIECRAAGVPVLLGGYPGCGKTAMVEAAFGDQLLTVEGNGDMETTDLMGNWTAQPDGTFAWFDGPLVRAMKEGKALLVDDCTLIPATVLARLYPAMDGRGTIRLTEHEGETITAQPGFFILGAHNPDAPGAILSEALASRFLLQIDVASDLDVAIDLGVDRRVIKAARQMRGKRKDGLITWAPEMRELLGFKRVADTLGPEVAARNLITCAPEDVREDLYEALSNVFPEAEQGLRLFNPKDERSEPKKDK